MLLRMDINITAIMNSTHSTTNTWPETTTYITSRYHVRSDMCFSLKQTFVPRGEDSTEISTVNYSGIRELVLIMCIKLVL